MALAKWHWQGKPQGQQVQGWPNELTENPYLMILPVFY